MKKIKSAIQYFVANNFKVLSSNKFEIKCLMSMEKTSFTYLEKDISTINIFDVIRKLLVLLINYTRRVMPDHVL